MNTINPVYKPLYKPNQLFCGTGHTAIITGWTVKEAIAKHLQPHEYGVIGQLYSPTRGINFLIRNLLANPQIRHLVVLNATKEDQNAKACDCLLDFLRFGFDNGVSDTGRKCWIVRYTTPGYIDIEVEADALECLRQSLRWQEVGSIPEAVEAVRANNKAAAKAWGKPLIFPMPELIPTQQPGALYGHRIEGKTIAETWVKIIHRIKTTGTIRPTGYDGQWQELIDLMAVVTDEPEDGYFPDYLPIDRVYMQTYAPQIIEDASYKEGVKYTYGQRLRSWFGVDQIEQCINKLVKEIDAASAVMSLWDVKDHERGGSPCLNHIWLRVVDNELSLTATLRSNDMFVAWVPNAMGLRALQKHIRDAIAARSAYNLKMGALIMISESAHIYDDCWESADRLIVGQYKKLCQKRNYDDASGSFIIYVGDDILVEHIDLQGAIVQEFTGNTATQLYRQIAASCPALAVEHAMYLGVELQKAAIALSTGSSYRQDRLI